MCRQTILESQKGRRESLSAGCFDFILPLSAAGREMARAGDSVEQCLMNGQGCTGPLPLLPIRTQLPLHRHKQAKRCSVPKPGLEVLLPTASLD